MEDTFIKSFLAEFFGTFILVFLACCLLIMCASEGHGVIGVMLLGIILAACIYMFGRWSGGHFNPAVSLSFWTAGRMDFLRMICFIVVQICAALCAVGLAFWFFGADVTEVFLGQKFNDECWKEVAFCTILVTLLCLTYLLMYENKNYFLVSGFVIGGVFAAVSSLCTSTNFASVFSASVFDDDWDHLWIYVCGSILGGLIAGLLARLFNNRFDAKYLKENGRVKKGRDGSAQMIVTTAKRGSKGETLKDDMCGGVKVETEIISEPSYGHHQVGLSPHTNRYTPFKEDFNATVAVSRSNTQPSQSRTSPSRMPSPARSPSRSVQASAF